MNAVSAIRTLTDKGQFDRAQAEATVDAVLQLLSQHVTSPQLEAHKADTRTAVAEIKVLIADAKSDLVRWTVGVGMLQTALVTALLLKLA